MREKKEEMHYQVASKGILGVSTSISGLKWSFGITTPAATREDYEACQVRLQVLRERRPVNLIDHADLGKYHYFAGRPDEDAIIYRRPFLLGSELQMAISGLVGADPTIRVNRAYERFITHRFMNLHSLGYIMTDIAELLLLRKGLAPLHSSCFSLHDRTWTVFAPPNTGKTLTTMQACLEMGASFLAEDLTITDGVTIFSVPWTSTFRYYEDIDRRFRTRVLNGMTKRFPPLELIPIARARPIDELVQPQRIISRSRCSDIAILERGRGGVRAVESEEAFTKILNLSKYEFNYHRAPVVVAYEFFNPELDIESAMQSERAILRKLIEQADNCIVVSCQDPKDYATTIAAEMINE